ncbi:MAG: hypothetical protein JOZ54_09925 [Acidobacteria bacterium]|nr:hypothetical protein [Acidobacteriota bacterium]
MSVSGTEVAVLSVDDDMDALTASAAQGIERIVRRVASGGISKRAAGRVADTLHYATNIAGSVRQVVGEMQSMAEHAAQTKRIVAEADAVVADCRSRVAAADAKRRETEELAKLLPEIVREEAEVRRLRAKNEAAELRKRLDATEEARALSVSARSAHAAAASTVDPSIAALHDRIRTEAGAIIREVQTGGIPSGTRRPYHAFAGCLYLRARLDGMSSEDAMIRAKTQLMAQMHERGDFTAAQIRAFAKEYANLKQQFDEAGRSAQSTTVLAALDRFGASVSGQRGSGR